jgi:hypothetical protein
MDATGLSDFSALPLLPLLFLFWFAERLSRRSVGFVLGRPRHYLIALLHPLIVIGTIVAIVAASGVIDPAAADWTKGLRRAAIIGISSTLVLIVTEEGFFRGWLFGSLERAGAGKNAVLLWSSVAFALWHISPVVLETSFAPPAAQIPVFLVNALFMGAAWGLMRAISGSVIVASVAHGFWNGAAYALFGFGKKIGALGLSDTTVFGPELGFLGLAFNALFVAALWWYWRRDRLADHAP